jgi:hypothetical protein
VQSYYSQDAIAWRVWNSNVLVLLSRQGQFAIGTVATQRSFRSQVESHPVDGERARRLRQELESKLRFSIVPSWIPVLVVATLTAAPWIRWRFSLSTLLIAMTFIAILLGVIAVSN